MTIKGQIFHLSAFGTKSVEFDSIFAQWVEFDAIFSPLTPIPS